MMSSGHYSDYIQTQDADMLEIPTPPATIPVATPPKITKRLIKRLAKLKGAKDLFPVNGERWCNKPVRPKAGRKSKKERPVVMKGALGKSSPRKPRKRVSPHPSRIPRPQPPNTPFEPVEHVHELDNGFDYSFPVECSPTSSSGPRPIDEDWLQRIRLTSPVSSATWENIEMYYPPPSPSSEMSGVMDENCNVESGPLPVPSNDPTWSHARGVVSIPAFVQGPAPAPAMLQYTSYEVGNEMLPSHTQSYSYPPHHAFANGWLSVASVQAEYRNDQQLEMQYRQAYHISPNFELLECPTSDLEDNYGDPQWHVAQQNNFSVAGSHYSSFSG